MRRPGKTRWVSPRKIILVCSLFLLCLPWIFPSQPSADNKKKAAPPTKYVVPTYPSFLNEFQKHAHHVGIQVVSIPSGKVMWEHRGAQPMVPASVVKILTSYMALKRLGPYYHFRTEVWAASGPQNGVIPGNVWIKGYGDPYFLGEKAWTLAQQLKAAGVSEIRGGVYVDNSYFEPEVEHICIDDRCHRPYNPVLSATALEFNTVAFQFFPGSKAGGTVRVEYYPSDDDGDDGMNMEGELVNVRANGRPAEFPGGEVGQEAPKGGNAGSGGPVKNVYYCGANAPDPVGYGSTAFRNLLEQVGIKVVGPAGGAGQVPKGARPLVRYQSPPLKDILQGLNRHSNNFMAEMLFRVVGASLMSSPGTVQKGAAVARSTLQELGVPKEEVNLDSGSGLSRTCRVSPRAFCSLLVDAYNDFAIGPDFIASMATNGDEGTLRKRLRDAKGELSVRGKTGTLNNVIGFAGYVSDSGSNKVYAVTILLNEVTDRWGARQTIDNFLKQLPRLAGGSDLS